MAQPPPQTQDTGAWVFQAWASFLVSVGSTALGIIFLPVDAWMRAFLAMGLLFSVNACFSLAKTVRDNHEASKLINRLTGAKAEKLLTEFEGRSPLG
jgi:hypothetical protein